MADGNVVGLLQITYETVGIVQMTFLRLLSQSAYQNVTFTCVNSAVWYNQRTFNYDQAIKLLGDNEQEFSAQGVRPNVIIDGCKVRRLIPKLHHHQYYNHFFCSCCDRIGKVAVKRYSKSEVKNWANCPSSTSSRWITDCLINRSVSKWVPLASNEKCLHAVSQPQTASGRIHCALPPRRLLSSILFLSFDF